MRIAYWIPKSTKTNAEYVILNVVPLQQWLQERASNKVTRTLPDLFNNTKYYGCSEKKTISKSLQQFGTSFNTLIFAAGTG